MLPCDSPGPQLPFAWSGWTGLVERVLLAGSARALARDITPARALSRDITRVAPPTTGPSRTPTGAARSLGTLVVLPCTCPRRSSRICLLRIASSCNQLASDCKQRASPEPWTAVRVPAYPGPVARLPPVTGLQPPPPPAGPAPRKSVLHRAAGSARGPSRVPTLAHASATGASSTGPQVRLRVEKCCGGDRKIFLTNRLAVGACRKGTILAPVAAWLLFQPWDILDRRRDLWVARGFVTSYATDIDAAGIESGENGDDTYHNEQPQLRSSKRAFREQANPV
jgi:hypothetical protein